LQIVGRTFDVEFVQSESVATHLLLIQLDLCSLEATSLTSLVFTFFQVRRFFCRTDLLISIGGHFGFSGSSRFNILGRKIFLLAWLELCFAMSVVAGISKLTCLC